MSELFDHQNAAYAQAVYEQYARHPASVPEAWRRFFDQGPEVAVQAGLLVPEGLSTNGARRQAPAPEPDGAAAEPTEAPTSRSAPARPRQHEPLVLELSPSPEDSTAAGADPVRRLLAMVARATSFVQAFRDHGHMLARIDPLGSDPPGHPQLDPAFFGTTMDEIRQIPASVVLGSDARDESLDQTLQRLRDAYCGAIGYEFEHLEDPSLVRWLWQQVESGVHTQPLRAGEKVRLLQRLSEVEGFEHFLHRTYLGQKRFSIEGTDMLVPMLDLALEEAAKDGGRGVVLGMAHRGRLNVLAHTVGIPYEDILREFEGRKGKGGALTVPGTGDVKYHHGADGEHPLPNGDAVSVTLVPNPSHLEFVNPVVEGMARSMQFGGEQRDARHDTSAVVPFLIHGDAAFAAEGVVAETLNLSRLEGYTTGGTIHLIANNQIGFTTDPFDGRSTRYASDVAKGYDLPILHVNADEPEACLAAVRLAMAYRAQYQDDVVIDLVGYRRHGHNEGDEPAYTQPTLYERISRHPSVRQLWANELVEAGVLTEAQAKTFQDQVADVLRQAQDRVQEEPPTPAEKEGPAAPRSAEPAKVETAVPFDVLAEVNAAALSWPQGFQVHPKLARQLERRREGFDPDTPLEWAHAETLAFGSLLREGVVVRLTGQDSERGTFSQRHLVLHDVETGDEHCPLATYGAARFEVYNSPLSEMAALGFEYGYSVVTERDLILWEAQFGDFVNVAQVAVDQFISSGREKWNQQANLGLLLPHGYEGQGPEHSSARLERFLTLCAEDNMRVVYPTTPAQYFHMLRRQGHARPEKPVVVMTPKSLLRHPRAASPVRDLAEGGFRPVLDDPEVGDRRGDVTRLVLCTGKIFYDLQGHEARKDAGHLALVRLEELYPFPSAELEGLLAEYPGVEDVVWVQEEPRNMGALTFVGPRLRNLVPRHVPLSYVARPERASPAEGKNKEHQVEQNRIVREALGLE